MSKKGTTIVKLPADVRDTGEGRPTFISEKDRDKALVALMKKGGKSARPESRSGSEDSIKRISLRIDSETAERVKNAAKGRPVYTPRHSWILEAILERLKKEGY